MADLREMAREHVKEFANQQLPPNLGLIDTAFWTEKNAHCVRGLFRREEEHKKLEQFCGNLRVAIRREFGL